MGPERRHNRAATRSSPERGRRGPSWRNRIAAPFALLVAFHRRALWRARSIRCPLLVTVGEHDKVARPRLAFRLLRGKRRGTRALVIVEGADHFTLNLPPVADRVARMEAHWFAEML